MRNAIASKTYARTVAQSVVTVLTASIIIVPGLYGVLVNQILRTSTNIPLCVVYHTLAV